MFLAIKMIHGMTREISKRVNYLKTSALIRASQLNALPFVALPNWYLAVSTG